MIDNEQQPKSDWPNEEIQCDIHERHECVFENKKRCEERTVGGHPGNIRIVQLAIHLSPGRSYQPDPESMFGRQEELMMTGESVPHWRSIQMHIHLVKRRSEDKKGRYGRGPQESNNRTGTRADGHS